MSGALLALAADAAVVTVRGGVPAPGTEAAWWDPRLCHVRGDLATEVRRSARARGE